ncbi:MAG: FGGY family carbohydrate kinase, partial [bacterium]|nr:FGGY family carbohydrate kinase [bacterium]
DTRTKQWCEEFVAADPKRAQKIRERTGLFVDAYFTAPKLRWILDHAVKGNEHLLAGTLDTWVLWHLTGEYMTDYTNACRTLLYDQQTYGFDLCEYFAIPRSILTPIIHPSKSNFGATKREIFGTIIPVRAMVGDQQSALYAAGTDVGATKITYGTGAFLMTLLGSQFQLVNDLYTTSALGPNGIQWYALEAKVENVVARAEAHPEGSKEFLSALRFIAEDVDLVMKKFPKKSTRVVVDGGISRFDALLKMQEEISGCTIERQTTKDATALGVHKLLQGI